ncbi:MAG: CDP-archaeol synthase [Desulfobulbaceae bacterium]|nr:MAG: CDP-archaeol synthase [Desulfobulbaceae bacterium]
MPARRIKVLTIFKIVCFLSWVNLLPPLACILRGQRFNWPLDCGISWFDRQPLFGNHKTFPGLLASLLGGTAVFPLLDVAWHVAGTAALLAMLGDLLSSFIKRRLALPCGKNVVILDQLFESLLPTLYLSTVISLSVGQICVILAIFIPLAHLGALAWNSIMHRPPPENYPRIIRSTVRWREWRSCHPPLARWHSLLNLSSILTYQVLYTWVFKLAGLHAKGMQNALEIRREEVSLWFPALPETFDQFTILFLTDLHLDGQEGLTDELIRRISDIKPDLCLIGGDIRMKTYGPMAPCLRELRRLLGHIKARHGILGVLGNHDCIEMLPDLEEAGMVPLVNESWEISENNEKIWVVGVDDPHYYKTHDFRQAFQRVPEGAFTLLLAHSPEVYETAAQHHADLYLCGHTHGGQICLAFLKPLLTNSRAPRFTASGRWKHDGMTGYTSRGTGASGVPLRFNCPGEISIIVLRRGSGP